MASPKQLDNQSIEQLLTELAEMQRRKLLSCGRQIIPMLTEDDILQPNDFLELENNPIFRYEEGILAGIQTVQTALRALQRDIFSDDCQA
jgi:hypothetical protein